MKSKYAALWLLLVVALVIVVALSFAGDITLGSWTMKKAPVREALLRDAEAEERERAANDSILEVLREEQEKMVAQVDSAPQSILLIGDSMTLNLAMRLAQYAKANGHSFHAVNWDSSGTVKWGKSRHLGEYIKEYGCLLYTSPSPRDS